MWAAGLVTGVLALLIERKRSNGGSINGQPETSRSTTQCTKPAQSARVKATPSTVEVTLRFVNPLDVSDVSDSEQYQGCRLPALQKWQESLPDSQRATAMGDGIKSWYEDRAEEGTPMLEPFTTIAPPTPSALETQVGGDHYKDLKIQPAEFLRQLNVPHLEGEAIYRILRHKQKGKAEDIDKAIHTLQIIRELDYGSK
jgi:hypothetical protein